jgi:hypothetical protein
VLAVLPHTATRRKPDRVGNGTASERLEDFEQFLTSDNQPAPCRLLARLFRERRSQLAEVGGIDVGHSPELQAPLTPTQHVVAIVA